MVNIACVKSAADPLSLRQRPFSLHELEHLFGTFEEGTKDGYAFIPALFKMCPVGHCWNGKRGSRGDGARRRVDCGGGAMHRLAVNVVSMSGFTMDIDSSAPGEIESYLNGLLFDGVAHFWWTTYSHTPEQPKYRIFIPFTEPMLIESPREWSGKGGAWDQLVDHFKARSLVRTDEMCRDPARIYYTPRRAAAAQ